MPSLIEQLRASVAQCAVDRLEAMPHRALNFKSERHGDSEDDRADVTLWAGVDIDRLAILTVHIEPDFGKQGRFLDLRPIEARRLAQALNEIADEIDAVIANQPNRSDEQC